MPKLSIDRVRPVIAQIRAGNFIGLGAGSIRERADRLYLKAIDGKFSGQERLDAYDLYKLSLQLARSTDPRAIMALRGLELGTPGDGWVYGVKFEADPIPRNDFERRVNDRDPNSELVARGRDWTIEVPLKLGEDNKDLLVLHQVLHIAEDFPGVTLAIPESLNDKKDTLLVYANHQTIKEFAQKLEAGFLGFDAYKTCFNKDGNIIWQLMLPTSSAGISFYASPKTTENLVNNAHGRVVAPDFAINTDVGTLQVREKNEDSAGYVKLSEDREVWVVADGMGGHARGDLASKLTVEKALSSMAEGKLLVEAVKDANREVVKANQEAILKGERGGAGSTVVALYLDRGAGIGQIAWVGDSRARFVTQDDEGLLISDHSRLFSQVQFKLRENGKDIELPINKTRMEEIEAILDAEEAEGRKIDPTYKIRSLGNIILAALGQGDLPPIGLVEFALGDGVKPARVALYSDGLVEGPEKEIESEIAVTDILRKYQPIGETADELLANAFSAGTTDNVTVAVIDVKEGLNLAELKEISGEKFQQDLIARINDVNYVMTMGEFKYMVEVYLLNPGIVPAELIERTKQKVIVSAIDDAVELMRKIDPSIPPVPAVVTPPPLPAAVPQEEITTELTDSDISSSQPVAKILTVGPTNGSDKWAATIKYDPSKGELTQAAALAIGQAFRPKAKTKFFSIVLSNNFLVPALNTESNVSYFIQLIEQNIKAKRWFRKKDQFYVLFNGHDASGQARFEVYREGELEAAFIKEHFPQ